jgi:hypothetical protein
MLRRSLLLAVTSLFAIPAFAEPAQAADPTTADCLAASESSLNLRSQHQLRAAREQLLVCAAPSCPADVQVECARRVEEVNRAIPTIVFEAKDTAGNDLGSVRINMDGKLLVERVEGTAISLDPGEHVFTFEAAGLPPVEKVLILREGEKERHERIVLAPAAAAKETGPESGPVKREPEVLTPPPPPPPPTKGNGQHTISFVVGGVGIAALGVGAIFGVLAKGDRSDYQKHCGSNIGAPSGFCDATGLEGHDRAASRATLATVFLVGGGVALAAGAAVFFTAPRASAEVGIAPGGAVVRGRF